MRGEGRASYVVYKKRGTRLDTRGKVVKNLMSLLPRGLFCFVGISPGKTAERAKAKQGIFEGAPHQGIRAPSFPPTSLLFLDIISFINLNCLLSLMRPSASARAPRVCQEVAEYILSRDFRIHSVKRFQNTFEITLLVTILNTTLLGIRHCWELMGAGGCDSRIL